MTNINRRYRLSGIAKAGALAGALSLASSAVAGGQFTTQYDDVKVRFEVTGLDPGGLLFFIWLPPGFDHDALPWGVIGAGGEIAFSPSVNDSGSWGARLNRRYFPPGTEYAIYTYDSTGWGYHGITVPNPLEDFQAPPASALGPETIQIVARPGGGADVFFLDEFGPGQDLVVDGGNFPLVIALRGPNPPSVCSAPGPANIPANDPVIGVYGVISQGGSAMTIGGGDTNCKAYVVHWGDVPMRFSVVGMTPDARIQEFGLQSAINGVPTGGVEEARFENLTIQSKYNACFSTPKGATFGMVRFYNCHFTPNPQSLASGNHSGFGYKWGIRSRGLGRYDIRDCSFEPVLEHCIYVDSIQGDSWFKGIEHNGSTRTVIQIVNRAFDIFVDPNDPADQAYLAQVLGEFESGLRIPQPSGFGRILIEDVTMRQLTGDGGAGITVAGHLGDIWIRNITAIDPGPFQGVITVYTDDNDHKGVYLRTGWDGQLYSSRSVTIENVNIDLPQANRDLVTVSGAEFVRIKDFSIAGNRAAISLDNQFDVSQLGNTFPLPGDDLVVVDGVVVRSSTLSDTLIDNGRADFFSSRPASGLLSDYVGWQSAQFKLRLGNSMPSDAQIDALWPDL